MAQVEIRALAEEENLGQELVREYARATAMEMDLPLEQLLPLMPDYKDFSGRYACGAFLVAYVDGQVAGCVGITRADTDRCEMNRLWVRPQFRGLSLGHKLAAASLESARQLGFKTMSLDVLSTRERAAQLYRDLDFQDAPSYHHYDFPVLSMERGL